MILHEIKHNHLKRMIEDYQYREIELSTDPIFYMEMVYSSFIVATFLVDGRHAIHLLNQKFIAVFTDLEEYKKTYDGNENLTPAVFDFDYILSANLDLIINPSSENIFINIDDYKNKPKTPFFEYDSIYVGFNCTELELVARKIQNNALNEFIKDPSRIYNYEEFFKLLKNSILLTLVYPKSSQNVVDLKGSISPIKIRKDGFLELFTNVGQIEGDSDTYVQVVNLAHFFEMTIRFDFEGIVINPDTNDIRMDREMILLNFEEFRDSYDPSKYMQADNYAFRLDFLEN